MIEGNNALLFKLEQDIARFLLKKLKHFEISLERASQIAKVVLAHLPDNLTDEQIIKIADSLDDEFGELSEVVYNNLIEYEKRNEGKKIDDIRKIINEESFQHTGRQIGSYLNKNIG